MGKFTMDWNSAEGISTTDQELAIRQVYVWFLTRDNKFLLVSKDGESWQLPGGKPGAGESLEQTAVREMQEETGVSIEDLKQGLKFFGYYRVTTEADDGTTDTFLQIRFCLKANVAAEELKLTAENEDRQQMERDQIMHVRAVTVEEGKSLVPWLGASGEFKELERRGMV